MYDRSTGKQKKGDFNRIRARAFASIGEMVYDNDKMGLVPTKEDKGKGGSASAKRKKDIEALVKGSPEANPPVPGMTLEEANEELGEAHSEGDYSGALVGDVVTKKVGSQWHVGIFAGYFPNGDIKMFGGNQGDKMNITRVKKKYVMDIRRIRVTNDDESTQGTLSKEEIEAINDINKMGSSQETR